MVKEIVLAIDPALHKIEEILLWRNRLKTVAVFTFIHVAFWVFLLSNIRTYCMISVICLFLHLLDGYRQKKRRELMRSKQALIENISDLGRYIIYIYAKLKKLWIELAKIKQKNRLKYFLIMFIFWTVTLTVGIKIKGLYLSYLIFWIVFFVPAIIHYDLVKIMIRKMLPLLEQLDHSMKYERRSVLDKSELLVDVKLPQNEMGDEEEDQYLESFKLNDEQRREFERYGEDGLDDEDNESVDEYAVNQLDEAVIDDEPPQQNQTLRTAAAKKETRRAVSGVASRVENKQFYSNDDSAAEDDSMLPDESLPNMSSVLDSTNDTFLNDSFQRGSGRSSIESGDRVVRKSARSRPSVLNYYDGYSANSENSSAASNNQPAQSVMNNNVERMSLRSGTAAAARLPASNIYRLTNNSNGTRRGHNDHDIDETFDFLDEELIKY